MKRLATLIIISVFAGSALFSVSAMNHSADGQMSGNCPVSSLNASPCPDDALGMVSHYIAMYQTFTNVIVSTVVTQVLSIALLFVSVAYIFRKYIASIRRLFVLLFILSRSFDAKLYRPQAITRWLSLLVNSPSLI